MIVTTAGHVDHGKTSLVKTLTGINTDRLPEERDRGLSIEVGYAYKSIDKTLVLGFVDVPGHRQFIKNMLASVGGIDTVLLVVAADDGIMPQTREHIAILDLLGFKECIVALTKIDLINQAQITNVGDEIRNYLTKTSIKNISIYPVSSPSREGIHALEDYLYKCARSKEHQKIEGNFRLAVDRCFTIAGSGLVVTGTIFSGKVNTGDNLKLLPSGLTLRIRGIHTQGSKANQAVTGERCALNIVGKGLNTFTVTRGDWVVEPGVETATNRMDARIHLLRTEVRGLKHWSQVHLYLGASHTTGRVVILENNEVLPGSYSLVQLVLEQNIVAVNGDRFILQDPSASRTIGGGKILDPVAKKRGRSKSVRLQWLKALEIDDHVDAFISLLKLSPNGISIKLATQIRNIKNQELAVIIQACAEKGFETHTVTSINDSILLAKKNWQALLNSLIRELDQWHSKYPFELGPNPDIILKLLNPPINKIIVEEALQYLKENGDIVRKGYIYYRPNHQITLSKPDKKIWEKAKLILSAPGTVPNLGAAAATLNIERQDFEDLLIKARRAGLVTSITKRRFLTFDTLKKYANITEEVAQVAPSGKFTVIMFRDAAGIGRNFSIELLEFFDRCGLTRRTGDFRTLRRTANELFD